MFLAPYSQLKYKTPAGSDACDIVNNAVHKTSPPNSFHMLFDQRKNIEYKSNEIRDLEPDTFPKIHLSQKAHEHMKCSDKPVFFSPHNLKTLCFSSLCDYLFICLLVYFSLPRVQRACV